MSDQGDEGQVPEPPGLEGRGELPPRPTVRESFRRGLFVRLPSEGEAGEGVAGAEQPDEEQSGEGIADQYPEQVADPYPGWRQAADGSWEAVGPEAYEYTESAEAAPAAPYPEPDQSADFASVAGGEPFIHEEPSAEVPSWTFTPEQEVPQTVEEAVVPVTPQSPEIVAGGMPEAAPEVAAEAVAEAPAPELPVAPEATAEVAAEVVPAEAAAIESVAVPEAAAEAVPATSVAAEDPVAATGLYIPADVELLEGDMPLYSEKENVPPRFAGSGLGEPCFIEFAELGKTLAGLRRLLPKGTRLTYNYDFERAWIRSSEGIDLPSFVERIDAPAAEGEATSS
jgi:hypothetical protein